MTGEVSRYSGQPIVDYIDEQYELHDADGDEIGDIVEINPEFLVAETGSGFLGLGEKRTYYVPRSYVSREEGSDWYLSIDKDELETMAWDQPPAGSQFGQETTDQYADVQAESTGYAEPTGSTETPTTPRQGTRLVRWEEELQAQTTSQQTGELVVGKDVVEETRTVEVPVRREELRIERRAVNGEVTDQAGTAFEGDEIRVPLMEEQVQIQKVARPVEEVVIGKEQVQETRQVQDTVRREEIRVDDSTVPGDRVSGN